MSQQVKLVCPNRAKKLLQPVLRTLFPTLDERVRVRIRQRDDRRYWRQQVDLFERLSDVAGKPSHIEIETISRCNSTCAFCPVNRSVDPRPFQRMEAELFHRIIDDLAAWDYDRVLNLYSNNEPFLDKRIFEFAAYAHSRLPRAIIRISSNGTALDVDKVERILPSLSRLTISDYNDRLALHDHVRAIIEHLNAHQPALAAKVVVCLRQLDEVKTNRAGRAPNRTVETATYRSRCAYPFFQMVIRPDGKVSLCCNDALGEVTLGDVAQNSVRHVWHSVERQRVQEAMRAGRDKLPICSKCDTMSAAKPRRIRKAIRRE